MKNFPKNIAVKLGVVFLFSGMGVVNVYAEEGSPAPAPAQSRWEAKQERIEQLKKLKQENPEEFQRVVSQRKEKIKERLKDLKEKDPERFEEVKTRMIDHRREKLRRLRREDPEKFHEIMENRAEKLKELKEKNPERYREFIKNHPGVADRLENRRDHREDVRDRREDVRDRHEDYRDRREDRNDRGYHKGYEQGVRDHGAGQGRRGQSARNRR